MPVGFCRLVHVFAPFDRGTQTVLASNLVTSRSTMVFAALGEAHQPTQSKGWWNGRDDLDRHLVGGTADTTAADLERWLHVVHRPLEVTTGSVPVLSRACSRAP